MSLFLFFGATAFLCGSLPVAYWTGKCLRGIDIREHGSGNAGATNVMRVVGKGPGYFVFAADFLKGLLPVLLYRTFDGAPAPIALLGVGTMAVLGHVFTPWLGFRGGKGVATGAGMLAAALPANFLIALGCWIVLYLATRTVSTSSLFAALALVISAIAQRQEPPVIAALAGLFAFVVWTHRTNISRLLNKKENRF